MKSELYYKINFNKNTKELNNKIYQITKNHRNKIIKDKIDNINYF